MYIFLMCLVLTKDHSSPRGQDEVLGADGDGGEAKLLLFDVLHARDDRVRQVIGTSVENNYNKVNTKILLWYFPLPLC